jgi:hypothetical protein
MQTIYIIANGDLRLSANQNCEAAQAAMEKQLVAAVEREGRKITLTIPSRSTALLTARNTGWKFSVPYLTMRR